MRASTTTCVGGWVYACMCVCVRVCVHMYMCIYIYIYILIYNILYIYAARAAAQLLLIPSFFLRFYDTKVTISILLSIPTHMPISERGKAALPNNGRDLHVLSIPLRKSLWVRYAAILSGIAGCQLQYARDPWLPHEAAQQRRVL